MKKKHKILLAVALSTVCGVAAYAIAVNRFMNDFAKSLENGMKDLNFEFSNF